MTESETPSDETGKPTPAEPAPPQAPATGSAPQPGPAEPAAVPDQSLVPPVYSAAPPMWVAPAPSGPPRPVDSLWRRIGAYVALAAVVAAAAGAGIGFSVARYFESGNHSSTATLSPSTSPIQAQSPATSNPSSVSNATSIAARVDPALVDINVSIGSGGAAGTGMIITSDGEVLTNHHVVAQSNEIQVYVQGRSQPYSAHVIGVDPSADVALIQIEGVSNLPTVQFASSSSVSVGDSVIALGNALGAGGTPHLTEGRVTALEQSITASDETGQTEQLSGMLQTDAVIFPGDSGGAVVNTSGQVIGMITAGQPTGFRSGASNVGYAVPSDTALSVVNRLRAGEQAADLIYSEVAYMGVSVVTLDSSLASQLGLSSTSGVLVTGVVQGSPADDAGLSRYSVITSFGGVSVTTSDAFGAAVRSHHPGDTVPITWTANDGNHTTTVTLGGANP